MLQQLQLAGPEPPMLSIIPYQTDEEAVMVSVLFLSLGVAAVGLVVVLWSWGQLLDMVSCPFEKNLLGCEDNGLRWGGEKKIDEGRR